MSKYVVYSDGSFRDGCVTSATVILKDGKEVHRVTYKSKKPHLVELQSVGAELLGFYVGIIYCLENGIHDAIFFSDCEYIVKTLNGLYPNAKSPKHYAVLFRELSNKLKAFDFQYFHVKGHANDSVNELCDRLAMEMHEKQCMSVPNLEFVLDLANKKSGTTPNVKKKTIINNEKLRGELDTLINETYDSICVINGLYLYLKSVSKNKREITPILKSIKKLKSELKTIK